MRSSQIGCTTPGPPTGSHGTRAARSLRLRVVGWAGEAGDGFDRPRRSRRSRQLGAGRGGWTSSLAAAERLGAWGPPPGQRCGPVRPTATRTGGPSHPKTSFPGARGPGPAESGLLTYSVLQVLGLALATPTRPLAAQGAPSLTRQSKRDTGRRTGSGSCRLARTHDLDSGHSVSESPD